MQKLLIFLSFIIALHAQAQSNESKQSEEPAEKTKQTQTNETTSKTKINTPDTFNPSEKLSKDVPTAFPVDI